jgi:uncharacterized protein YndB with AHSA1/START domain
MQTTGELAVRKSVTVKATPERAFEVFTAGVATWWPLEEHSIGEKQARTVAIEPRVGGRFYETADNGDEHDWGTVTAWDPPSRFACTWHPGNDPAQAQDLDVRFIPDGDGTRVELAHTGWERRENPAEAMEGYDSGWDVVLGELYARAANAATD